MPRTTCENCTAGIPSGAVKCPYCHSAVPLHSVPPAAPLAPLRSRATPPGTTAIDARLRQFLDNVLAGKVSTLGGSFECDGTIFDTCIPITPDDPKRVMAEACNRGAYRYGPETDLNAVLAEVSAYLKTHRKTEPVASLRIVRDSGFTDRRRNYQVLLDGNKVGHVAHAETKRFPVSPGRHKLRLKIDWCGSRDIEFDAKETEELIFRVTNLQSFIAVLLCMFLSPSSYLKLRQISAIAR